MANTTVQSEQIEDGSITADKLADGTIVAAELADNAVVTAAINADAVTGAKIADNAIDSEHYTDGSIDTAHIADSQITVGKMAANSVDSDQYVDGSIDTVHIADAQVTTAKITDGNISTAKIADNAVTSAKIDTNIDIAGTFDVTGATTLDSTLAVAGVTTITTADNTDTLSLISTDADANVAPNLRMYRNSGSPADSDQLGKILLVGRNDNSQDVIYAQIGSQIKDASDGTEDGRVFINSIVGGTTVSRIDMTEGETVFNNDTVDLDFRVESDNKTHALFVDGGTGNVGISAAPESAYVGGSYPMLEIGHAMYGSASGAGTGYFGVNVYLGADGNWKYKDTTGAFLIHPAQATLNFYHAASGTADSNISFSKTAQLDADGLKFGSDTAAANALDDYEEGIFTATLADSGGGATYTLNSSFNQLSYTKVGRLVTIHGTLVVSGVSGTPNGSLNVSNLPFTSANLTDQSGKSGGLGVGYYQVQKYTSGVFPQSSLGEGSTALYLFYGVVDANTYSTYANTATQLYFDFTYPAA